MTRLGCLVALPKLGSVFKVRSKTRHSLQSPNFYEPAQSTRKVSLRFWSPSLHLVCRRQNRALKRLTGVPIAMLRSILPRSALMNAESGEGMTSTSNQLHSVTLENLLMTARSSHRRILELATAIKSTFEPVIQTHLYPRSRVDIFAKFSKMAAFSAHLSVRSRLSTSPLTLRSLILRPLSRPVSFLRCCCST